MRTESPGPESAPDHTEFVTTRAGHLLHTETFEPATPSASTPRTLLMIMGGNAPCFAFPSPLCRAIADAGHRVVRYDHRGAGYSSPVHHPAESYALDDLASDAAEVVEGLRLGAPVVYGISTGGAVAQLLALDHPERVSGLVLMATSPDYNVTPSLPPESGLPLPGPEWRSLVESLAASPPTVHAEVVESFLDAWRVCVGPETPFDEGHWRGLVERTLSLPGNPTPGAHQGPAVDAAPPRTERLAAVRVPTLVIHGGQDVVLPPEHGRALAAAIPDARLVEIPELGHMFTPEFAPRLAELLVEHLESTPAPTVS
ncbi:alpha/beta fold hydrolase [Streptomyces sp. AJS327]|uniref:alpha/beta fold hydrolase n=1 Tax=Streptomyces sp. AJS327 TaxID=2545265 RepID=UPI0015DF2941|nr:alpha/beta fold hydrolase [Streptomyces sp. AJS327]MBA0050076.1 alpha/beta fold hydrolase [Streptomyces sp. AJS327]